MTAADFVFVALCALCLFGSWRYEVNARRYMELARALADEAQAKRTETLELIEDQNARIAEWTS